MFSFDSPADSTALAQFDAAATAAAVKDDGMDSDVNSPVDKEWVLKRQTIWGGGCVVFKINVKKKKRSYSSSKKKNMQHNSIP